LLLMSMVLFVSCGGGDGNKARPTYKIGYMICNSEEETLQRFRPLTAYLSKKLGVNFEAVAIDTIDFTGRVDELDFTHTNSLLYIIMNRFHGVEILAAEKAGSLGDRSKGAIVALKKSGIKSLKDLKGKTMVFGPVLAPTGYLTQLDLFVKEGIEPEDFLSSYTIPPGPYKHEKVIYGVMFEKYHAGAFPMLDFERMAESGKIDPEDFVIVAEGEPIPYCNFAVTQRVDESLAKRFKKALLELDEDDTVEIDGEVVKVLNMADINGYADVKDEDFDEVREMAKRTNMPPYQSY